MNNSGYDDDGLNMFDVNPIDEAINSNEFTVKTFGNQTISGDKVFTGTVTIENEIIHDSTTFSTQDGIIEQLRGNTGDMLDYGNYGVYNDGVSTKYKGLINKKQTDKFYVFHNQTEKPLSSLNLSTQDLGSIVVRDPVEDDEVATKRYVESHSGGNYLPLIGGTLTGDLSMSNKDIIKIRNLDFDDTGLYNVLRFPTSNRLSVIDGDGTPFMHFNSLASNQLIELSKDTNVNGNITMLNSKRILGLLNPISNDEPANKSYADTKLSLDGGIINGDVGFSFNNRKLLLSGKTGALSTPEGNFITTISNNDLVIYKGLKFFALNNNETYTNQRLNMSNNNIINCDSITANRLNITTNTGIINFGDNTVDNILGGNSYTQIAGGNDKYFVCNQLTNETNNNINMTGNEIINCESITCQGSVLTLSAGGGGAFRITNTLSDSLVPIRMNGHKITNLGTPTADTDTATKKYVDDAVNGGGDVHLPKYHKVYFAPTPDSGETYKTYTNDGFGQVIFDMSSPILSTTSGYALWNINMPPLNFNDELVTFIIKIKEDNTVVETIECGGTYNGSVGSGYLTMPNLTKGCHEFQTASPSTILGLELICKPRGAINSTAKLNLDSNSGMDKIYRVFDVELININT